MVIFFFLFWDQLIMNLYYRLSDKIILTDQLPIKIDHRPNSRNRYEILDILLCVFAITL